MICGASGLVVVNAMNGLVVVKNGERGPEVARVELVTVCVGGETGLADTGGGDWGESVMAVVKSGEQEWTGGNEER